MAYCAICSRVVSSCVSFHCPQSWRDFSTVDIFLPSIDASSPARPAVGFAAAAAADDDAGSAPVNARSLENLTGAAADAVICCCSALPVATALRARRRRRGRGRRGRGGGRRRRRRLRRLASGELLLEPAFTCLVTGSPRRKVERLGDRHEPAPALGAAAAAAAAARLREQRRDVEAARSARRRPPAWLGAAPPALSSAHRSSTSPSAAPPLLRRRRLRRRRRTVALRLLLALERNSLLRLFRGFAAFFAPLHAAAGARRRRAGHLGDRVVEAAVLVVRPSSPPEPHACT